MLQELLTWPDKLQTGADLATQLLRTVETQKLLAGKKALVFVGMGGSGIAGHIIKELLAPTASLPVFVYDTPVIPYHVTADALVIVSSFSGNTWETVAAFDELRRRNIVPLVISHGGILSARAQACQAPLLVLPACSAPRAALGFFLGALCTILSVCGYYPAGQQVVRDIIAFWGTVTKQLTLPETYHDFFDQYASSGQRFFHIWGVSGDTVSVAYRAQTQFNENSKVDAVSAVFPEVNHNLLVGFTHHARLVEQENTVPMILFLGTDFMAKEMRVSFACLQEVCTQNRIALYKPAIFGDTWERQFFYLMWWADYASYFLGCNRQEHITQTLLLDKLKHLFSKKVAKL